jgi:hypothetical protein
LRERNFAQQLGRAGRIRVEQNFSANKMVDGMVTVFQEVTRTK